MWGTKLFFDGSRPRMAFLKSNDIGDAVTVRRTHTHRAYLNPTHPHTTTTTKHTPRTQPPPPHTQSAHRLRHVHRLHHRKTPRRGRRQGNFAHWAQGPEPRSDQARLRPQAVFGGLFFVAVVRREPARGDVVVPGCGSEGGGGAWGVRGVGEWVILGEGGEVVVWE
jgi:hypothetical protein